MIIVAKGKGILTISLIEKSPVKDDSASELR